MSKRQTKMSRVELVYEDTIISSDAAVTEIKAHLQHDSDVTVRGSARRHPADRPDADIAALLSQARAYKSLANKIEVRALGLMKHKEDMRANRAAQLKAREAAGKKVKK